jgi:hypothetical protein
MTGSLVGDAAIVKVKRVAGRHPRGVSAPRDHPRRVTARHPGTGHAGRIMATTPTPTPTATPTREPQGTIPNVWVIFAGIMLVINGCLAIMFGLAAVLNDEVVTVGGGQGVTIWDFTVWGWVTMGIGALMTLTGVGLVLGYTVARWAGVTFAVLGALAQFGMISAFPLWSLLVIALSVVIIYQLIANWDRRSW